MIDLILAPGLAPLEPEQADAIRARAAQLGADCVRIDPDGADATMLGCSYVRRVPSAPPFERIRRITGYLVGDLARWNSAKRAEERDRVKHGTAEWSREPTPARGEEARP